MLKLKKLKRLGFRILKASKERKVYTPRSFFGECLFNLQRLKAHYHNLNTSYIKNFVKRLKLQKKPNLHGELVSSLESRLDAVLFKSGLVNSIGTAAQKISHKKILVNGKIVNIRSFQIKVGSLIEIKGGFVFNQNSQLPDYLNIVESNSFRFVRKPRLDEINFEVPIDFAKVISSLR